MRRRAEEEAFSRPVQRATKKEMEMDSEMDSEMESEMDSETEMPRKRVRGEDDAFYESMVSRREGKKQAKEERKKYQEMHVREDYVGQAGGGDM